MSQRHSNTATLSSDRLARSSVIESRQGRQYLFNLPAAIRAASLASVAITLYMMFVPRWLGIEQMDIGITIGAMTDPTGGIGAWLARVSWHVSNGMVYVFAYAAVLVYLQMQSNGWTGVAFGFILWLLGPMLLVPALLNLHPAVASGALTHPGIFMLDLGLGGTPAIVDLCTHLLHGIVAGVVYKHQWVRIGVESDG